MVLLRSLLFEGLFYLGMAVVGLICLPAALITPRGARAATRIFSHYGLFLLRVLCGVRVEVRGEPPPKGAAIVAAAHQSFLDVVVLNLALPEPRFVLKRELMRLPIFGWYVKRMGATAIDRAGGSSAMNAIAADSKAVLDEGGQFVIYPQGTRTAPGAVTSYKGGAASLYRRTGVVCAPVAVNVGFFWGRRRIRKRPGVAVVEFLPVIPPGVESRAFLALLEARIESASARLLIEALEQAK